MKYIDMVKVEQDAKSSWDKDISVRQEFATYETYLAYKKAEAEGKVKILGEKQRG